MKNVNLASPTRTRLQLAAVAVGLAFMLVAPAAQAVYVDLGAAASSLGSQTLSAGDQTLTITKEQTEVKVSDNEYTLRIKFDFDVTKIEFDLGPATVTSIDFADPSVGKAQLISPDTQMVVEGGLVSPTLAHEIRLVSLAGVQANTVVGVDISSGPTITPTSAIPEPSAALLFAAGLTAAASASRRR